MKPIRLLVFMGVATGCLSVPAIACATAGATNLSGGDIGPLVVGSLPGIIGLLALVVWSLAYSHGQDESTIRAAAGTGWDWVEDQSWSAMLGERHRWMMVLPDGSVRDAGSKVTFGSASDNEVVLFADPSVLPHHAKLQWYGGDLVFTDLSGGDSRVGGRPVRGSVSLRRGTTLRLGRTEIVVHRDVSGLGGRSELQV